MDYPWGTSPVVASEHESIPALYEERRDPVVGDAARVQARSESRSPSSMVAPGPLVAGTKLVRPCSDSCLPKFRRNPSKFLPKLPQDCARAVLARFQKES